MEASQLLQKTSRLIDEVKTGILATTDGEGRPHLRWMVPAILQAGAPVIYTVSAPDSAKIAQLTACPRVEWMFQNRALTEIINLRGQMNVLENPSLRLAMTDAVGHRLHAFWKKHPDPAGLVVLETVLTEGAWYVPMAGTVETVRF